MCRSVAGSRVGCALFARDAGGIGSAGGYASCAALYAGSSGGCALFARGAVGIGGTKGDALYTYYNISVSVGRKAAELD